MVIAAVQPAAADMYVCAVAVGNDGGEQTEDIPAVRI